MIAWHLEWTISASSGICHFKCVKSLHLESMDKDTNTKHGIYEKMRIRICQGHGKTINIGIYSSIINTIIKEVRTR